MRRAIAVWVLVLGCGPGTTSDDSSADTSAETSTAESGGADESSTTGEAPPGDPGGLCVLGDGGPHCSVEGAVCNEDDNYCYFPDAPCDGFDCGGADRGTCTPQDGLPTCMCNPGFDNEMFALYCCPLASDDPNCPQ